MYIVTSTAGLIAETLTSDDTLASLQAHLRDRLQTRPIGWTITSPWGLVHEGRLNLNGSNGASSIITGHIELVAEILEHEISTHT